MSNKSSDQLVKRFKGEAGKRRLRECLQRNSLVVGSPSLAAQLVEVGRLLDFEAGAIVTQQGAADNDIYFLLSGTVTVTVNGRQVATRGADCYFGEMALIDPTALRSASVVADCDIATLRVTEKDFSRIARTNARLWRRVATEIAARLRERNKFHKEPNQNAVIFIGSSSEGLPMAERIGAHLMRNGYTTKLWSNGVFGASESALESLLNATAVSDFAVLVLSADDQVRSRGTVKSSPRDNVVFELGLFMGAVGRHRTFIIGPKDINLKVPTDLLGITLLNYTAPTTAAPQLRLREINEKIVCRIEQLGPR